MIAANGCWIEDELWYWDVARQALCTLNLGSKQISIKFMDTSYPGYKVFAHGERVYVTCQNVGRVLVYYRDNGTTKEMCLPEQKEGNTVYFPVQWERYLYLVPLALKQQVIFRIDMENDEFIEIRELTNQLKQEYDSIAPDAQFLFPCICDGVLWSAIAYTKYYVSYHLTSDKFCVYSSEVGDSLWSVKCVKGTLYMTQSDSTNLIVKRQNEAECIVTVKADCASIQEPYSCIESLREYQVVLARMGRDIVVLDSDSLECKTIICLYDEPEEALAGTRTISCVEDETYIYVLPWLMGNLYAICKGTWEVEQREFKLEDSSRLKYVLPEYFENKKEDVIVWETTEVTLRDLCMYLANTEEI